MKSESSQPKISPIAVVTALMSEECEEGIPPALISKLNPIFCTQKTDWHNQLGYYPTQHGRNSDRASKKNERIAH